MKRFHQLLVCIICLIGAFSNVSAIDPPNIVVILCDDLGYGDLECYGHPHIKTPNLNQLADSGVRLTSCYSAAPVCSPSRVGLLTGRSPNRAGVYDWIPPSSGRQNRNSSNARAQVHMRKSEVTIPALLNKAGYSTCMAGKWHCNSQFNSTNQPQPGDFGFDHWMATQNNASPSHENPMNFVRNGKSVGKLEGYSCQIVTSEAIQWLDSRKDATNPFFLFVPFHEPHEPVASPKKLVDQYRKVARNENEAQYFANVANVDAAVGRLVKKLTDLKIRENTIVIFTSDNGPETLLRYGPRSGRSFGSPKPLRGMKLHVHEAGFGVAGIISWPARIKAGRTSDQPISSLDFLPTFCEVANADIPSNLRLDGTDISPFFDGQKFNREKPLFWCYFNAISQPRIALRSGDWKILASLDNNKLPRYTNLTPALHAKAKAATLTEFELYNLKNDRMEKNNLVTKELKKLEELKPQIEAAYQELLSDSHIWIPRKKK